MLNLNFDIGKLSGSMLDFTYSLLPEYESVMPVIGHAVSSLSEDPEPESDDTGIQITLPTKISSAKAASPPLPQALVPDGHA